MKHTHQLPITVACVDRPNNSASHYVHVFLLLLLVLMSPTLALAQSHTDHVAPSELEPVAVGNHVGHGASDNSSVEHLHESPAQPASTDTLQTNVNEHDHTNMSMPMETVTEMPAENNTVSKTRDPHAYSNGHQLGIGPYSIEGQRLVLADEVFFGGFRMSRLEQLIQDGTDLTAFDSQAWYGSSYNRLSVKASGELSRGSLEESETEFLWFHAIGKFWNTQLGMRFDASDGPNRNWVAAGVQGIAPYWFELDVTAYLGDGGRTALNFEAEYDLLLSQRLIVQPRAELNFYGKDDVAVGVGSGLSDSAVGLRLQYQITRKLVPYIGVEKVRLYGKTVDFSSIKSNTSYTRWLAGLSFWF